MTAMTINTFNQSNATSVPGENGTENSVDWKKFAVLFQSFNIVSTVVFSLVSVLGLLGNGVVIWVTVFKMKTTVNTVWYLNLAAADFIFSAFLPLTVTSKALWFHWPFGKFMCKLNMTVLFLTKFVSVYILLVITVDRCVSVVWPVWAQNHRNVRKASCVSVAVWAVALILNAPYFFFMDTEQKSANKIVCFETLFDFKTRSHNQVHRQATVIFRVLLGFVVPFTVIVSCYAVIIHRLRKSSALASKSSRSFKIITAIIVTFFFCWAPFHIMGIILLEIFKTETPSEMLIYIIVVGRPLSNCLAFLNSCMNPLLYVFIRQDFKDQVRKSILNVLETAFQEEDTHTSTVHQAEQIEL